MRESARIYRTSAKARYSRGAFARQTGLIRARLLASTILESDETGARVGKQTWWIWVFHHGVDARFVIHKNRSRAAVEGFLGAYRPDFWVSDRLPSQMNWAKKDHQVCLAHLIRDAQYAIDAGDGAFAPRPAQTAPARLRHRRTAGATRRRPDPCGRQKGPQGHQGLSAILVRIPRRPRHPADQ
jgi:hypothetical protein